MEQTASEMMVAEFGKRISTVVDDLFAEFKETAERENMNHDLVLTAMALGSVSAATGIIMEISDEDYARKVIRQSAKIIHKTMEMKNLRDKNA